MPIRVAVIGDVGGHVKELRRELRALGASETGVLPDDLVVIQVGTWCTAGRTPKRWFVWSTIT